MGDERNCVLSFWNVEIDIDFLPSRPKQCLSVQFLSMSIFLLENPMGLRSWINYWLIGQMKIQRYTNTALPEIPNTDLLISFIELGQIYCLDQHCQQQLIWQSVEYFDSSNSSGSQIISKRWKWKFKHNWTLIPSSEVCQLSLIRCHFFQLFLVCQISVKIMPYFIDFLPKCNCAKFYWYIAIFH